MFPIWLVASTVVVAFLLAKASGKMDPHDILKAVLDDYIALVIMKNTTFTIKWDKDTKTVTLIAWFVDFDQGDGDLGTPKLGAWTWDTKEGKPVIPAKYAEFLKNATYPRKNTTWHIDEKGSFAFSIDKIPKFEPLIVSPGSTTYIIT